MFSFTDVCVDSYYGGCADPVTYGCTRVLSARHGAARGPEVFYTVYMYTYSMRGVCGRGPGACRSGRPCTSDADTQPAFDSCES